nr:hypothetical protein VITISV_025599 [Vitis vinifera]
MDFYQSMTTQGARSSTAIHFSIDGRQGILEARHVVEALHIPYEPVDPIDFREISKGFYFGPHHLIMVVLLHFEEKVHRKNLQKTDTIPLLFLRLLYHILEYMGYTTEPHLERCHHCREQITLNKWTQLAGYSAPLVAPPRPASPVPPQTEQAQQDELPMESVPPAPAPPMPEATSIAPPTTPVVPLVAPSTYEASITICAIEFRAMDQHTAILRQIQQHLGLLPPPQPDIPGPSKPIAPVEETIPAEETTRADVSIQATHEATTDPSSPLEAPTT